MYVVSEYGDSQHPMMTINYQLIINLDEGFHVGQKIPFIMFFSLSNCFGADKMSYVVPNITSLCRLAKFPSHKRVY